MQLDEARDFFDSFFSGHDFGWQGGGRYYLAYCPFHDDRNKRSFNIFIGDDGDIYYKCFACGASGKVKNLLRELRGDEKRTRKGKKRKERREEAEEVVEEEIVKKDDIVFKKLCQELLDLAREELKQLVSLYQEKLATICQNLHKEDFAVAKDRETRLLSALCCFFRKISLFDKKKEVIISLIDFYDVGILTENVIEKIKERDLDTYRKIEERIRLSEKLYYFLFPHFWKNTLVEIKFRNICENSRSSRVLKVSKGSRGAFGYKSIYEVIQKNVIPLGFCYVVEGETDALSFSVVDGQLKYPALGIGGTSNYRVVSELVKDNFVIIFPDFDEMSFSGVGAGRKAVLDFYEHNKDNEELIKKVFVYCDEDGYFGEKDVNDAIRKSKLKNGKDLINGKIERIDIAVKEFNRQYQNFITSAFEKAKELLNEQGYRGLSAILTSYLDTVTAIPHVAIAKQDDYGEELLLGYPRGKITVWAGSGGTGKTTTALLLGDIFLKQMLLRGLDKKVLVWSTEQTVEEMKSINDAILSTYFSDSERYIAENFYYSDMRPESFFDEKGHVNKNFEVMLEDLLRSYDLVMLDPLLSFYGNDENQSFLIRKFFDSVNSVLKKITKEQQEKYLFFLVHTTKVNSLKSSKDDEITSDDFTKYEDVYSTLPVSDKLMEYYYPLIPISFVKKIGTLLYLSDQVRGSGDIKNACRLVQMFFSVPKGKETLERNRILVTVKRNYPTKFKIGDGFIIPDIELDRTGGRNGTGNSELERAEDSRGEQGFDEGGDEYAGFEF